MNVAKKIQECFLICWKTLQKWNLNIRTYTCHAFQILQEITTYSPADTSLAFSSTFLPLVGRPGFIFRGLVGVFPLPVPPPPVCMKWANSSVCLSKNSNLLPLSASYKNRSCQIVRKDKDASLQFPGFFVILVLNLSKLFFALNKIYVQFLHRILLCCHSAPHFCLLVEISVKLMAQQQAKMLN